MTLKGLDVIYHHLTIWLFHQSWALKIQAIDLQKFDFIRNSTVLCKCIYTPY